MNISDEAFDAAYEAYWASGSSIGAALEAAAPFLMAQAWDEGYETKDGEYPFGALAINPYRSTGANE